MSSLKHVDFLFQNSTRREHQIGRQEQLELELESAREPRLVALQLLGQTVHVHDNVDGQQSQRSLQLAQLNASPTTTSVDDEQQRRRSDGKRLLCRHAAAAAARQLLGRHQAGQPERVVVGLVRFVHIHVRLLQQSTSASTRSTASTSRAAATTTTAATAAEFRGHRW